MDDRLILDGCRKLFSDHFLWYVKIKLAAFSVLALHIDPAAHVFHKLSRDRKPQPGSLLVPVLLRIDLLERPKQLFQILRLDALPGIPDRDPQIHHVLLRHLCHFYRELDKSRLRKLDRIVCDIDDDLSDSKRVTVHPVWQILVNIKHQFYRFVADPVEEYHAKVTQYGHRLILFLYDIELARLDLGEIEDIIDDREQRGA